jgi:hypothetical protein
VKTTSTPSGTIHTFQKHQCTLKVVFEDVG